MKIAHANSKNKFFGCFLRREEKQRKKLKIIKKVVEIRRNWRQVWGNEVKNFAGMPSGLGGN